MFKEWQLVESQRDGSHEFSLPKDDLPRAGMTCTLCGRPRWAHVLDGFRPTPTPSSLSQDSGANYRGPHPAWSRPGSFSKLERHELEAETRKQRAEIERAIAEDQAKYRASKRSHA